MALFLTALLGVGVSLAAPLMNLDMHATRKVTAVVKGRRIAAALKPLEVKEIGL